MRPTTGPVEPRDRPDTGNPVALPHFRAGYVTDVPRSADGLFRRPIVGMSSKMNLTSTEASIYLDDLRPLVSDLQDREVFVLLPFTSLWVARERLSGSAISWGAQDVHPDDRGAHTGDVSAPMLADLGCRLVEVGHHERRRDHGETDELVRAKVDAVQRWGMTALVCIGEDRHLSSADAVQVIERQLESFSTAVPDRLVIAYEPAWAIGVGARPASPAWIGRMHSAIRSGLRRSNPAGTRVPIIYGGSVGPRIAAAVLAQPSVDGLFVGRQALDPAVFAAIAHTNIETR
jgi:triosephosphate isomerase